MEPWKIGVIAALVIGLGGYGLLQQKQAATPPLPPANSTMGNVSTPTKDDNKAAVFIGQSLGGEIPNWKNITPWTNTKTPLTPATLKGKPALVEFFRVNCSHCQDAAPFLEQLYKRYQPRGLQMVAIQSPGDFKDPENPETQWPVVQDFIKSKGLTYPVGFDKDSQYFQKTLKGTFYPTTMIADPTGEVVYAQTGHDEKKAIRLAVELEKLLPGKGDFAARGKELANFLKPFLPGLSNPAMLDALGKDLADRLSGKVAEN